MIDLEHIDQEVAIIGMSGRFPQANTLEEFWQNLRHGLEAIQPLSNEDLLASGIDQSLLDDPAYVKVGSAIAEPEYFDAKFFHYAPREAEIMDPQQRIFLECAFHAFEHAGYNSDQVQEAIGVFAGAGTNTYLLNNLYPQRAKLADLGYLHVALGNNPDYLALRTSYKLNLHGPSLTVQTACSTGLVAVHLACQSLLSGECSMALAGAVSISSPQKTGYMYSKEGVMSPDGHCRAFDVDGQGTSPGNGVGVVILKRLTDALADHDTIHAIIKGTALSNDGADRVGFTAPGVQGQVRAIQEALALAGVDADNISYIEAHGTATPLGDTIELTALNQVFRSQTDRKNFCALGSVKTNIGHLDAAAGMAGMLKTVQALKHRELAPSLHFNTSNPDIDMANSPFYVNTHLKHWQRNHKHPRRAGVSSFGLGGTNAHIVLEEAPIPSHADSALPWQLLTISAKTATALEQIKDNLRATLIPNGNLSDIAYTLQVSRSQHPYRTMFLARDTHDALAILHKNDARVMLSHVDDGKSKKIVFLFPGLGDLYNGIAAQLYEQEAVFRQHFDECANILQPILQQDIHQLLYPQGVEKSIQEQHTSIHTSQPNLRRMLQATGTQLDQTLPLNQTIYAHPILFVIEYALAKLWQSLGIYPDVLIGYSLGEYVAACLADTFSLKDALTLVALRAKLIQNLPTGIMLAVFLGAAEIALYLHKSLYIAAINAPNMSVVTGTNEAVEELEQRLRSKGIAARRLQTQHAFHSPLMQPAIEQLQTLVQDMQLSPPSIPSLSCLTGDWITSEEACDPHYWLRHLCQPLQFQQVAQKALKRNDYIYIEIGPGRALGSMLAQNAEDQARLPLVLRSLRDQSEDTPDRIVLLHSVGRLWLEGVTPHWRLLHGQKQPGRIPLPLYPFERQRYYIDPVSLVSTVNEELTASEMVPLHKRTDFRRWLYQPSWKKSFIHPVASVPDHTAPHKWLVFQGTTHLSQRLVEELTTSGNHVITVCAGTAFTVNNQGTQYTINPTAAIHYQQLVKQIQSTPPDTILHLWNITSDHMGDRSPAEADDWLQQIGFYSLLYLTQALGKHYLMQPLQLQVISTHLQDVTGTELLQPEKSTLLAPCKVIPQEYAHIACRSIDIINPTEDSLQEQQLIQALLYDLTELLHDKVVAYRGTTRWLQTYTPLELDQPLRERQLTASTGLRQHGVYLILGGLGKIGLVLAQHLAQYAQAKIILVNQTPFPDRQEWTQWLTTHSPEDALSQKILQLQVMEAAGAEVHIFAANIANLTSMTKIGAFIEERFGALHGVIHSAGVTGEDAHRLVHEIDATNYEKQLQAKLHGLRVLETLLADRPLDFCLIQSSLSPILGGLGFTSYAAGNLYLDSFLVQHNRTHRQPWIGVNWEGWTFETLPQTDEGSTSTFDLAITPAEALKILPYLLYYGSSLVVSTGDLQQRIHQWIQQDWHKNLTSESQEQSTIQHQRPDLHTTYVAPRNEQEQHITAIWEALLGMKSIGIHDSFFELGGHSLLATQLLSRIRQDFHADVSLRNLFSTPTIANLSAMIEQAQHDLAIQTPISALIKVDRAKYRSQRSEQGDIHLSETFKREVISQSKRKTHE